MYNDKLVNRGVAGIVNPRREKTHRIVFEMETFIPAFYVGVGMKTKGKRIEVSSAVEKMNVGLPKLDNLQKLEGKVVSFENQ